MSEEHTTYQRFIIMCLFIKSTLSEFYLFVCVCTYVLVDVLTGACLCKHTWIQRAVLGAVPWVLSGIISGRISHQPRALQVG